MPYSPDDQKIYDAAMKFAKANKNKTRIAKEKVDSFPQEENPVSVFMAGSPGAGKTEAAKSLIEQFDEGILRIDNDELRNEFEGYNGTNSHIFQDPATRLLEALHDRALKRNITFILDTTLSNYEKAKQNIKRSLKRKREVVIIFVYQNPEQAWSFVKARETVEGRRVPPEVFVNQFFSSQEVVNKLKEEFKKEVKVELLVKNIDGSRKNYYSNVENVSYHLKEQFERSEVERIVGITKR